MLDFDYLYIELYISSTWETEPRCTHLTEQILLTEVLITIPEFTYITPR